MWLNLSASYCCRQSPTTPLSNPSLACESALPLLTPSSLPNTVPKLSHCLIPCQHNNALLLGSSCLGCFLQSRYHICRVGPNLDELQLFLFALSCSYNHTCIKVKDDVTPILESKLKVS